MKGLVALDELHDGMGILIELMKGLVALDELHDGIGRLSERHEWIGCAG
jgi:hypothetical protein